MLGIVENDNSAASKNFYMVIFDLVSELILIDKIAMHTMYANNIGSKN